MKRRAALQSSQPAKRPRTQTRQLAVTQEIVRKELRKKTDWKYADLSAAAANVNNSGVIVSLYQNLNRGDGGLNGFDGNIIRPQAVTMKYYIHTSEVRNVIRVMLLQWFDSATPSVAGLIQSVSTGLATIAPTQITNKDYIKVLYDRTHQIAPTAGGGSTPTVVGEGITNPVKVYIPGRKLRATRFNATSNAIVHGNLLLLVISDDLVTPNPQITYYTRVTFSDD